jgi:hypothetical protein
LGLIRVSSAGIFYRFLDILDEILNFSRLILVL